MCSCFRDELCRTVQCPHWPVRCEHDTNPALYDGFMALWLWVLNVHYVWTLVSMQVTWAVKTPPSPCNRHQMSSAVTLTDPVSLTKWPHGLSQPDVCCCQSHASRETRGCQNPTDQHRHMQPQWSAVHTGAKRTTIPQQWCMSPTVTGNRFSELYLRI